MSRVLLLFFLLLITICHCEDLYEILGVSRTADKVTIKREYIKLAKKWHPDKNRSPEAANTMMKINKAYEVLSNDIRRRRYDLLGEESDKMPPSPSPQDKSFKFGPSIFILYLDHFYDYFYHNWETIMAFINLPLPTLLILISCYLFLCPKRRA